jgi:ATP-dependent Clp protease ATP-binding subunit ClpB
MDKLTIKAQEAIADAQERAAAQGHQQIEPLHVLAALAAQKEGVVAPLLGKLGVHADALRGEAEAELAKLPQVAGVGQQYLSPATNDLLKRAFEEAGQFKDEYVSTEHLLLALAGGGKDAAARLLAKYGAKNLEDVFIQLTGRRIREGA